MSNAHSIGWLVGVALALSGCGFETHGQESGSVAAVGYDDDEWGSDSDGLSRAARRAAKRAGLKGFPGADRYDHSELPAWQQEIIARRSELGRFLFQDRAL